MARTKLNDLTKNKEYKSSGKSLNKLFKTGKMITDHAPSSGYVYFVAIILRYVDLIYFILKPRFTEEMHFVIFEYIEAVLQYLSLENYIQTDYGLFRYFIFYIFFIILVFYMAVGLYLFKFKFSKANVAGNTTLKFLSFFSLIILNAFSASLYILLLAVILHQRVYMFGEGKTNGFIYFNLSISVVSLTCLLIIVAFNIWFVHNDNPFTDFKYKGSSKLVQTLIELEKIVYAIYFIIDIDKQLTSQFLILVLVLNVFKIYLKIYTMPFVNSGIRHIENFIEAFYVFIVISLNYYVFFIKNGQNEVFFYTLIIGSFVFQYVYIILLDYFQFRNLSKINEDMISKKDAARQLYRLGMFLENYDAKSNNAKMLNYIVNHNSKCKSTDCKCHLIIEVDEKSKDIRPLLVEFIEFKAIQYHNLYPKSIDILIYLISICIYETKKVFKAIKYYNDSKLSKKNIIASYELYKLR